MVHSISTPVRLLEGKPKFLGNPKLARPDVVHVPEEDHREQAADDVAAPQVQDGDVVRGVGRPVHLAPGKTVPRLLLLEDHQEVREHDPHVRHSGDQHLDALAEEEVVLLGDEGAGNPGSEVKNDPQGDGEVGVGEQGGLGEVEADGGEAVEEDSDEEDEGVGPGEDLPHDEDDDHHGDGDEGGEDGDDEPPHPVQPAWQAHHLHQLFDTLSKYQLRR